jgi:SAM-dependent methyltransferase
MNKWLMMNGWHENFKVDIPFHLEMIKRYGDPVLELACGTGRLSIPFAENGYKVTGLDVSDSMLAQAKENIAEKKVDVNLVHADCRDFKLDRKFNVIIFPFNSIAHLHELEDIEKCFRCVKEHLADDGRFIIDIFNPDLNMLVRDPNKRYSGEPGKSNIGREYPDPYGNGMVRIEESNIYDKKIQINHIKFYFKIGEQPEVVNDLNMRIFFPQEMDALLRFNGFEVEEKFGSFDMKPFESDSPKQLIVNKKR